VKLTINTDKFLQRFVHASRQALFLTLMLLVSQSIHAGVQTDKIQSLITDGKLRQALTLTNKQLEEDKGNVTFRFLKGLILTRLNELDQARDLFIDLTREHPDLPEPYNNLAVIYASQGDFDNARDALQRAISTHPSYATAHENMGDIYAKMASKAYNQALELDSENTSAKAKLSLINDLFFVPKQQKDIVAEQMAARKAQEEKLALEARTALAEKEAMEARKELDEKNAMEAKKALEDKKAMETRRVMEQKQALEAQKVLAENKALEAKTALVEKEAMAARKALEARATLAEKQALEARNALAEKEAMEAMQAKKALENQQVQEDRNLTELKLKVAVATTVDEWAKAWSAKNAGLYTGFYGVDFTPPKKLSRSAWESQRKVRLEKPKYIDIKISDLKVTLMGDEHARAEFRQGYQSDTYRDEVNKSLILKKVADKWLITQEDSR
jgi:colicin import membrane protein